MLAFLKGYLVYQFIHAKPVAIKSLSLDLIYHRHGTFTRLNIHGFSPMKCSQCLDQKYLFLVLSKRGAYTLAHIL